MVDQQLEVFPSEALGDTFTNSPDYQKLGSLAQRFLGLSFHTCSVPLTTPPPMLSKRKTKLLRNSVLSLTGIE